MIMYWVIIITKLIVSVTLVLFFLLILWSLVWNFFLVNIPIVREVLDMGPAHLKNKKGLN
jgi:hypothetical protein